ncbi:MAG: ABC transporter ATP-binding protein [Lentisphaeraceae bacterium]|nr:ABC transporter ATP-binding protein [Lentisphaeraceae bacterium]
MSAQAQPLLQVRNLTIAFENDETRQAVTTVQDVSFEVNRGEILCVVGESGCGKSVSSMCIPRLLPSPPAKILGGEILFEGVDLLKLPIAKIRAYRGKKIGVIFQDPMTALSPLVRIGDQIVEAVRIHDTEISKEGARAKALAWLEKVGIQNPTLAMRCYPYELSGGMQQRVMIAMCLILEPQLIIADEPTTALDVTIQAQVLELMLQLHSKDSGMIFITHDMGVVYKMADRVAVMYAGQVVEQAPAAEFFAGPKHPYARALLEALPSHATRGKTLRAIPGQVPSPGHYAPGCRFSDRCDCAREACATTPPDLRTLPSGRLVRCPFAE